MTDPRLCESEPCSLRHTHRGARGARLVVGSGVRFAGIVATAVFAAVGASAARSSFHLNFTQSLPIGLYRRIPGAPSRGDLVVACVPERAGEFARIRRYLWRGGCPGGVAPVGKLVLAVAGDTLALSASGFVLNGQQVPNSRVATRDSRKRPMPHHPFGTYVVKSGELWLYSPYHPLSFDSRYFGPIAEGALSARIEPLWTDGALLATPTADGAQRSLHRALSPVREGTTSGVPKELRILLGHR